MPVDSLKVIGASASSNADATAWIPLNINAEDFRVGFTIWASGAGQPTVRVEHTMQNVMRDTTNVDAFIHDDVSGVAINNASNVLDGNYAFPVRAIRGVVVSSSGAATVHMRTIQSGY